MRGALVSRKDRFDRSLEGCELGQPSWCDKERGNRGGSELVELGRFEELVATYLGIPHGVFIDHVDGERIMHLHRKFRAGAVISLELAELRLKLKELCAIDRRGSS